MLIRTVEVRLAEALRMEVFVVDLRTKRVVAALPVDVVGLPTRADLGPAVIIFRPSGHIRAPASINQDVTQHIAPDTLTRPPAEVLDAVARTDLCSLLRRLGVPGSLAPDLLQEVVMTAYLALHRKGSALPLPGEHEPRWSRVRPFLAGILRRLARDALKRAHHQHEILAGLAADLCEAAGPDDLTPEERAASAQRLSVLLRILAEMPVVYAEVLILHGVRELTIPQIAAMLGANEDTVRSRLARARAHAQRAIGELPDEERDIVTSSPLAVMFLWRAEQPPAPPWLSQGVVAGIVVFLAALWIVGVPVGVLPPPSAGPLVAAVHERAPGGVADGMVMEQPSPGATRPMESVAPMEPAPMGSVAPPATAAPRFRVTKVDPGDTLAAEKIVIHAARRALDTKAYGGALVALSDHERRYPQGRLAGVRAELIAEVRARVRAKATAAR